MLLGDAALGEGLSSARGAPLPPPPGAAPSPAPNSSAPEAARRPPQIQDSVVKLFVTRAAPSYLQPWQMKSQVSQTGSGAIIEGRRILTNAHVVSDQVFIQALRGGQTRRYTATVEFVAHDCDLALLRVADASFFEGATPLKLGTLPALRDEVAAYGFPKGGQKLSITTGVVSRIEIRTYSHSQHDMLAMQLDAAINPGNSGGPVVKDREIVGVAFQTGDGQNLGYAVPVPVIEHFLKDVEDSRYDGIPALGVDWQPMESASLRAYYGLGRDDSGVLVTRVPGGRETEGVLRAGDVLMAISGHSIAADGTIDFGNGDRIAFPHALLGYQVGDLLTLRVMRDRRPLEVTLRLGTGQPLVPRSSYDRKPTYFLFAGMVFMPLTENYMDLWQDWRRVPANYRYYYSHGRPSRERSEVVLLTQILAHDVTLGYHSLSDLVVTRVNDLPIGSMRDLRAAFLKPAGGYHVIECEGGERIVLDAVRAQAAHAEILKRYGIPRDRSTAPQ
jgi:S1-C subfamily serine protease